MENRKEKNEQLISAEEAAKIGIREGMKYIKEQEYYKTTKKYDRRLRNTKLLLKNYRKLMFHTRVADNSINEVKDENVRDVLDGIESINDEEQYIQAISRTKKRTQIMIEHINKVLEYYEHICDVDGNNKKRRYRIIERLFIEKTNTDIAPTYEDIAKELDISIKTVGRDVRDALNDISTLLFGIDGIKL